MSFIRFCTLVALPSLLMLSACSSTMTKDSAPVPELTFTDIAPYNVEAARVVIDNQYKPGADPKDVSSKFPTPPDIILKRYAENRFRPGASSGVMNFVIEDARVYERQIEQEKNIIRAMGVGKQDQYELMLRMRLFYANDDGFQQGQHGILTFNRTLTMPSNVSLAERERRQMEFLDVLVKDADVAITKALQTRFSMTAESTSPVLLSAPELR